jgi:hypothetical protein
VFVNRYWVVLFEWGCSAVEKKEGDLKWGGFRVGHAGRRCDCRGDVGGVESKPRDLGSDRGYRVAGQPSAHRHECLCHLVGAQIRVSVPRGKVLFGEGVAERGDRGDVGGGAELGEVVDQGGAEGGYLGEVGHGLFESVDGDFAVAALGLEVAEFDP